MINFKSKLVWDNVKGDTYKRVYRIFRRVGFNRLSTVTDIPPEKKVKKLFFRAPGRLAYDIRHKLLSQRPKQ